MPLCRGDYRQASILTGIWLPSFAVSLHPLCFVVHSLHGIFSMVVVTSKFSCCFVILSFCHFVLIANLLRLSVYLPPPVVSRSLLFHIFPFASFCCSDFLCFPLATDRFVPIQEERAKAQRCLDVEDIHICRTATVGMQWQLGAVPGQRSEAYDEICTTRAEGEGPDRPGQSRVICGRLQGGRAGGKHIVR